MPLHPSFLHPDRLAATMSGVWFDRPDADRVAAAEGVSTDTRTLEPGEIFVALRGPRHDGHAHLPEAARRGAVAAIVHDVEPPVGGATLPRLRVEDTGAALLALGAAWRRDVLAGVPIIGVTGSNGKTTTKAMMHAVLERRGRGSASPASYNNAIGVPLTLLGTPPHAAHLVAEVGMNAPGEIAPLARVLRPDHAVITSIGSAHLEALGSLEAIAAEKASLLEGWDPSRGSAILPADAPLLEPHVASIPREACRTFGLAEDADLRPTDVAIDATGTRFRLADAPGRTWHVPLPGRHHALNACAAIAAGRIMGLPDEEIAAGLTTTPAPAGRTRLLRRPDGVIVLDDAYNANPTSMSASFALLADLVSTLDPPPRRIVVVIGDMLELGTGSEAAHRDLAATLRAALARRPPDRLVCVGRATAATAAAWREAGSPGAVEHHPDAGEAVLDRIAAGLVAGDLVLVKGSRGLALERIFDRPDVPPPTGE